MHRFGAGAVAMAMAVAGLPVASLAQERPEGPPGPSPFSFGVEVTGTVSTKDNGFFTYTDYDQDTLRQLRVRLLGEWRVAPTVSLVGEARTLNADRGEMAAAYVRWEPTPQHDLSIQIGRIPPVIGAFARRAYGRDNPLLTAPLAYQYVTSLRPDALPADTDDLLVMRGRGWRPSFPIGSHEVATGIPLVSATRWHSGGEVYWRHQWFEAAGSVTLGSPGAPLAASLRRGYNWSGRAAATFPSGLVVGVSGSRGRWVDSDLLEEVGGDARAHATQSLIGADAEWGRGPWLLRGEWMATTFAIPMRDSAVDRLGAWSGFLEGRYRVTARWQVASRIDGLRFDRIAGIDRPSNTWEANVTRIEGVVSYRATRHLEARGAWLHHWRDGGFIRRRGAPAAQLLFWF